jgi:protein gp37
MIDILKGRYWDKPWSLIDGCSPCSPGCDHCWSAAIAHHYRRGVHYPDGRVDMSIPNYTDAAGKFDGRIKTNPDRLSIPLKRRKPTVYAIWNDAFHLSVPFPYLDELHKITAETIGRHTYLILTKRPERMRLYYQGRAHWENEPNIFKGLTVCNQAEANEKIPVFLQVPGKKFLSIEPCLGLVDLFSLLDKIMPCNLQPSRWLAKNINAVVLGGETGPGARPMHRDWVRSVRDQCAAACVPFYFKGWGKHIPVRQAGSVLMIGRELDRRTHDDLPWRTNNGY